MYIKLLLVIWIWLVVIGRIDFYGVFLVWFFVIDWVMISFCFYLVFIFIGGVIVILIILFIYVIVDCNISVILYNIIIIFDN